VDLKFVNNVVFDLQGRYLIGYGKHKIFILNIKSNKSEIYEINRALYVEIYSLKFASTQEG